MKVKNLFFFLAAIIVLWACTPTPDQVSDAVQLQRDKAALDAYIKNNGITGAVKDSSGLRYVAHSQGTGAKVTVASIVGLKIKGKFTNNDIFLDDTVGAQYLINTLIVGLQEGIPLMNKGGSYTFYIPSGLAWGVYGSTDGTIPSNTIVIFDVRMIDDAAENAKEDSILNANLKDVPNVQTDPSGLRFVIVDAGTGSTPTASSLVSVSYTGTFLLSGTQFGTSQNSKFYVYNAIQGWQIGLPHINVGGKIKLYVPSRLAYGASGSPDGTIPPNSILVYDISLLNMY